MDKNTPGCGFGSACANTCRCGENGDVRTLLQQIDFVIIETTLYLNVYPECQAALEYLAAMRKKRAEVAKQYEEKYGMLTMYGVCGETNGKTCAWPWEYDAN